MLRLTDRHDCEPEATLPLHQASVQKPAETAVLHGAPSTRVTAEPQTEPAEPQAAPGPEVAVVSGLLRIAQRIRSILNQGLADSGLNEVRLTVMQVLHDSSPAGCSQSELADALQQSESSVSTLVERMRSDGLLYRLRSNADRRKRVLMLTAEGRDLLEQVEAVHAPRMRQLLSVLPADDVAQLGQLLDQLTAGLNGDRPLLPESESAESRNTAA